jgi:quinohemoprotein ethanol dehydrogenase
MSPEVHSLFKDILLRGAFSSRGMASFGDILEEVNVERIHAYLIDQSWQAFRRQQAEERP